MCVCVCECMHSSTSASLLLGARLKSYVCLLICTLFHYYVLIFIRYFLFRCRARSRCGPIEFCNIQIVQGMSFGRKSNGLQLFFPPSISSICLYRLIFDCFTRKSSGKNEREIEAMISKIANWLMAKYVRCHFSTVCT